MTAEDLKPAKQEQRIHPEVTERLRKRGPLEGPPTPEEEQQLASVDGTVEMKRSARDPRLALLHLPRKAHVAATAAAAGSFRPDPLLQRSQVTPQFVRGINSQHARWDDSVYHRTPKTRTSEERRPQGENKQQQQQQQQRQRQR
ncbi:hypothetical protein ETH_00034070 [Eimeria tenella]|uniref:Uncharacterized protein n=1 Tax=Eimeria tenella TaxID=5802 RepID=U6KKN1_EIMTE|nr:hypothetical protein ETH_00034070 [Eimeria tenella]CDJ38597.1 hypothetical protein ETH_00034070 [Eimeria tenella]|eukprot:XP_013229433.1 hypothetical protein ETH_00034070 [Eimeria tenella]